MANFDKLCSQHQREPEPGHRCKTCARIRLERKIVRKLARALIDAGKPVTVDYERGYDSEPENRNLVNVEAIVEAAFAVDEVHLMVGPAEGGEGPYDAFVFLVFGNDGYDVISDYSCSLEPVLAPVNAYADQLEERAR